MPAIGAETAAPTSPASEVRAFALTRVRLWGTSRGTVAERVYVGTTTQVIVELGPETRIVALEQNTHVSHAGDRWEIGHPVTLSWRP